MTDTDKLEQYILKTFAKFTDDRGTPLDVTFALPLIKQILTGYRQEIIDRKFDYIGESAVQFAISLILAKRYYRYENSALSGIAKKFRVPLQLYKYVGKQIALNDYVKPADLKEKMGMLLGVLYHFYGITAVQKIIENAVVYLVDQELNIDTLPIKSITPASSGVNPVNRLYELIQLGNGTLNTYASEISEQKWQVKIVAKINEKSLLFSHSRTNSSKQKAKTEASMDILTFFDCNPKEYQQFQLPEEDNSKIHVLPINESDYCHLYNANNTNVSKNMMGFPKLTNSGDNFNYKYLSQNNCDFATMLLKEVLLDKKMNTQQ